RVQARMLSRAPSPCGCRKPVVSSRGSVLPPSRRPLPWQPGEKGAGRFEGPSSGSPSCPSDGSTTRAIAMRPWRLASGHWVLALPRPFRGVRPLVVRRPAGRQGARAHPSQAHPFAIDFALLRDGDREEEALRGIEPRVFVVDRLVHHRFSPLPP